MIRLTIPSIEDDDLQAVREVLASGYLVQGRNVVAFEKTVAEYVGVKHAVAASNCTAALHLSLLALDVRPGDIVVTTAYSWIATANVIELCGAQPIFVDIKADTFSIDPNYLENTLKNLMANAATARRVKAILPVHAFGQLADMPAIIELSEKYNLPVIEDAACALGAALNGRQAGAWGTMGCFSFHPRKAITTGEGGIITTNDAKLAHRLQALRNHGQDPKASPADFIMPGFNYRLTDFQAALGLTQMNKLNRIIEARRRIASTYGALLANSPLQIPVIEPGNQPVYQSYVVLLPEKVTASRDDLIRQLREQGIEAAIGTLHIPMTSYFRTRYNYRPGDFPKTDQIYARSITLPLYETLSKADQRKVIKMIISTLSELSQ